VFAVTEHVAVGEPVCHQVEELPLISVKVTEHRAQRVRCPGCGEPTRRQFPAKVASSALGRRFQAAVATLSVRNRTSRRDVVELCEHFALLRVTGGCFLTARDRARWRSARAEPCTMRSLIHPRAEVSIIFLRV